MSLPRRRLGLVVAGAAAAVLAACSRQPDPVAGSSAAPAPTTSRPRVSAGGTGTVAAPVQGSRLTGLPVADGPVLAVKVDNTAPARPRVGLHQADVVYVEPVEGGLTRLNAVYSTRMPAEVGPVRSGRASDIAILGSYGEVAFAYSGASTYTNNRLRTARLVNVSMDQGGTGYRRAGGRPGPYDVMADPAALLRRAGGSVPPADVGFVFGPLPEGGSPVRSMTASYPSATIRFDWDATARRFQLSTDGTPDVDPRGRRHGASTVVVQRVEVRLSRNTDATGARTPDVVLVGTGRAHVLRDGRVLEATWTRSEVAGPTTFTDATGARTSFAPGNVWVLLVGTSQRVALG